MCSPIVVPFVTKSEIRGNVLIGDVVDDQERKIGWVLEGLVRL